MCGINGFNWCDDKLIRKMNKKIKHRGPDDSGVYVDKKVSLGNTRLSIIDLSKRGRQPMCNEKGDLWIVYNGEIYNFKTIREELEIKGHKFNSDTDTEVVLHAYEEYGFECLNKFNGMWAFCLYDANKKILFLSRDRIGIKPLYFYWDGRKFIFSSEIKAILEHEIKRKVNKEQLHHYLSFICTTREKTLFDRIYKIPSGNFLVFDIKNNKFFKKKYWSIDDIKIDYSINEREAIKKLDELITSSIVMRRVADVPQGVFLSGGIDSSCLVAVNSEFSLRPINTFSIYFEGAGKEFDETYYARKVAEIFGTNHKEISLNHDMLLKFFPSLVYYQDEPISDPVCVPIGFLAKEVKRNKVKMIHVGEGGDEIFVGYRSYFDFLRANKFFNLFSKFPESTKNGFSKIFERNFSNRYLIFLHDELNLLTKNRNMPLKNIIGFFEFEKRFLINRECKTSSYNYLEFLTKNIKDINLSNEFLQKMRVIEYKLRLPELLLMRVDKFTMMHSIESRVPFMDYRVVEYGMKINPKLHYKGNETKYLFKKLLKEKLPKDIVYRKKVGFNVPLYKREFLNPLVEIAKKELLNSELSKFFDLDYIKKIIKLYETKRSGYEFRVWVLLNFAFWYKRWIKDEKIVI